LLGKCKHLVESFKNLKNYEKDEIKEKEREH